MRTFLLVAAGLLSPTFALADAKQDIRAAYAKMAAAAHAKDATLTAKYLAPDFTGSAAGKILHRADFVAAQRKLFARVQSVDVSRRIASISVQRREAVVMCNSDDKLTMKGPDGRLHSVEMVQTSQDVWDMYKGKWLLKHVQVLKAQSTVDHKHVPLPGFG